MKVLKNNYSGIEKDVQNIYPKTVFCKDCLSELQYDKEDMYDGVLGCMYIKCPLCGCETILDNEDCVKLTKSNVEFPKHFYHFSVGTGAVDNLNNEEVKRCINKAIDFFRLHKDEYYWCTATGCLSVVVFRYEGDEEYVVSVTGDHYETNIPFEREDY